MCPVHLPLGERLENPFENATHDAVSREKGTWGYIMEGGEDRCSNRGSFFPSSRRHVSRKFPILPFPYVGYAQDAMTPKAKSDRNRMVGKSIVACIELLHCQMRACGPTWSEQTPLDLISLLFQSENPGQQKFADRSKIELLNCSLNYRTV